MLNILLFLILRCTVAMVNVNPEMRSFSYAIKNGFLHPDEEKTLYERNTGEPGVITEQWFTGKKTMDQDTRIRIYIDDETEASLDFQLFLAHGIGFNQTQELRKIPWATKRLGHTANGGIYNTFRIPFGKCFKVTASRPTSGYIWYIVRGMENYPLIFGDLKLPKNTRLKLYKNENVVMKPLEFLSLANIKSSAGALFMVTLAARSSNLRFLEGCVRAYIDGSNDTTWLSSGTEDFFLSSYYFNKGTFHADDAGLTYLSKKGLVSAYKFFESDPLIFSKSFELWWRCSDDDVRRVDYGCPHTWPNPSPFTKDEFLDNAKFAKSGKFPAKEEKNLSDEVLPKKVGLLKRKIFAKKKQRFTDDFKESYFGNPERAISKREIVLKQKKISRSLRDGFRRKKAVFREGKSSSKANHRKKKKNAKARLTIVTTYTWIYQW